ncbi:putative disease resistance RPP13-like protein 1 isoform X2 [Abrus precatorius]|uniref:Disease resistance RPP13-like protein 1 isoform X2 n=1 Tax=Abrus precatorius TaxID=3816 RepID=A0A8B8JYF4_ABRPR|nr:putative disease resistance RPP13-like protein 1 isoform X2 [Abrus precatorius]
MALVGEALLSASVHALVEKIVSTEFKDLFCREEFDPSILNKLKITLLTLRAVLNDAEEQQIRNPAVQEWLHELKDSVYDVDSLLDEIYTKSLQRKVEAKSQSFSYQARNFLSYSFKQFRGRMNFELQNLMQRLEHFAKEKGILGLKEGVSGSVWNGTVTTSVVDQSIIYGRDGDIDKLREYLLSDDDCDNHVGVITIVGMGGLGKTTLAQLLYNDQEVKQHFSLKAWACITNNFDVVRVTKTLLESVSLKPVVTNNLDALHVELQQSLSGRKFLFVLDDLWDTYNDWNRLKAILRSGEVGSKIIITTRQENVALAMHTFPIHNLMPLSHQDCWDLLAKHAFGANQSNRDPKLEEIGREIAAKCDGLPLAAEALGSLLRTKLSEKDWNRILKSNIWDLPNDKVLLPLLLSYYYLPPPLKGCFAYCSIFPKNYELNKEMLVRLWMAEGLIQFRSNQSLEETGDEYFDELVSRSFIRKNTKYFQFMFTMHDLINDLATAVSGRYCFRYDSPKPSECLDKIRYLSYSRGEYDYCHKFDGILKIKCLRTFIALPMRKNPYQASKNCYLAKRLPHDLFLKMRYLRVLSLSHYDNITELSDSLGNFIHLRYLDLSYTKIRKLPNGTCKLYNLQTLLLSCCSYLIELPQDMDKLINLRHSDLSGTKLKEMPSNVSRLKCLKTLTCFVVSKKEDGLKVRELTNFPHLQGKLSMLNLQHVVDANDAFQSGLRNMEKIEELELEWGCNTEDSRNEREVLDQLQPSSNLKHLTIKFYGGTTFPNWLGHSSFCNMVSLTISDCNHCWLLPPLGQLPALKQLIIDRLKSLNCVGVDFYGRGSSSFQPFACLKYLKFKELPCWEEWLSISDKTTEFPSLEELCIFYCPKLKGNLPNNLPSLKRLRVVECDLLELQNSNEVDNIYTGETKIPLKRSSDLKWISTLHSLHVFGSPGVLSLFNYFTVGNHDPIQISLRMTISNSCLRILNIKRIPSLIYFQKDGLPTSLMHLHIHNYKNASQSLTHLKIINVANCPNLDSFPQDGLPTPNLEKLFVHTCENLKCLPEWINTLTGLQELSVYDLPCLESFAKEGLPCNLQKLGIVDSGTLSTTSIIQWGTRWLTFLIELTIGGDDLVDALMKKLLLPTSLESLCIRNISFLDGKGLQHLTSLENLQIINCPNLELLPEKELLPLSLSVLGICECPLLQITYQRNGGVNWPRISHIPCIKFNEEVII